MTTPDDTAHPSAPDAFERALCRILARTAQALTRIGRETAARAALAQGVAAGRRLGPPCAGDAEDAR